MNDEGGSQVQGVNLEAAVHARWAATPPLSALLPAERLRTGVFHGQGRPYATLQRRGGRTLLRTNAGDALDEVRLAVHIWHDSYDAAWAIAQQVKAAFDRTAFDLPGGGRAIQVRRTGEWAVQRETNIWHLTVEFSVSIYLESSG
ncbi:MAG: DUF3168 domain-containing protein [Thermoguttaceae bacterium]